MIDSKYVVTITRKLVGKVTQGWCQKGEAYALLAFPNSRHCPPISIYNFQVVYFLQVS